MFAFGYYSTGECLEGFLGPKWLRRGFSAKERKKEILANTHVRYTDKSGAAL